MGKKGTNNGNQCAIPWHSHAPNQCPGRARLKCRVCGKSLLGHKLFELCERNEDTPAIVLDELGMRRRLKDE